MITCDIRSRQIADSPTRLTIEAHDKDFPVLSQSGDRVDFARVPSISSFSYYELRSLVINGTSGVLFLAKDPTSDMWSFDWSPDGRYVMYGVGDLNGNKACTILLLPLSAPPKSIPISGLSRSIPSAR